MKMNTILNPNKSWIINKYKSKAIELTLACQTVLLCFCVHNVQYTVHILSGIDD